MDGKIEIKYTEHVPAYISHFYQLAADNVADSYRDNGRLVYFKVQNLDRGYFPPLQEIDGIYLMFKHPEPTVMSLTLVKKEKGVEL